MVAGPCFDVFQSQVSLLFLSGGHYIPQLLIIWFSPGGGAPADGLGGSDAFGVKPFDLFQRPSGCPARLRGQWPWAGGGGFQFAAFLADTHHRHAGTTNTARAGDNRSYIHA